MPKQKPQNRSGQESPQSVPPKSATSPIRKKPTILKSGNATSSNKGKDATPTENARPSLFGSWTGKVPLTLLNEYCQKQKWERPSVDAHRNKQAATASGGEPGYSAVVHLKRKNPKDISNVETVTIRPPSADDLAVPGASETQIDKSTALEARHFGATLALFRVANHLNLKMQLPLECRPFWSALEKFKSACPPTRSWLWDPNPFEASLKRAQQVAATQARLAAAADPSSETSSAAGHSGRNSPLDHTETWPELKMPFEIREGLQQFVSEYISRFDDTEDGMDVQSMKNAVRDPEEETRARKNLLKIGFKPAKVDLALSVVQNAGPKNGYKSKNALQHLFDNLSVQDAALEYLKITVAEVDLPPGFRQAKPDVNVRVASAATSKDLASEWRANAISSDFGFPTAWVRKRIAEVVDDRKNELDVLSSLVQDLTGRDCRYALQPEQDIKAEISALQAVYDVRDASSTSLDIRLPIPTPATLRVLTEPPSSSPSPSPWFVTCLVQSLHLPAYQTLYLTQQCHLYLHKLDLSTQEANLSQIVADAYDWLSEHITLIMENPPDPDIVLSAFRVQSAPVVDSQNGTDTLQDRPVHPKSKKARTNQQGFFPAPIKSEAFRQIHADMLASKTYQHVLPSRTRLPAFDAQQLIQDTVNANRICLISGATGSGKTTQSPQFVLDNAMKAGDTTCNIIVTQPRRLAAIGVATRVAEERAERLGDGLVGYQIRGDRKAGPQCRLLFMTTGVLLRRMMGQPNLDGVTHVFVDEVHEKSIDSDFLLLELRELLQRNRTIKIIMMSATPDPALLSYFPKTVKIEIPGVSYPVTDLYLEDIIKQINYRAPSLKASRTFTSQENALMQQSFAQNGISESDQMSTLLMLTRSESQEFGLIAEAVERLIVQPGQNPCGVLIFTSGVGEINQILSALRSNGLHQKALLLPLHAALNSTDQARVFQPCGNCFKIIVATNIAETSITIDDIEFVMDTGRVKEVQWDSDAGVSKLVEVWTSRAAAKQRRGRAGRTKPGTCLKLYSRYAEDAMMPANTLPEMLRTPLEQVVLSVVASKEGIDVVAYLSKAISSPLLSSIQQAVNVLIRLEAVIKTDQSLGITPLGRFMSSLPMDLRLSKFLVLSAIFGCVQPALITAACLSGKPLFLSPPDQRQEARDAQAIFCTDLSDPLAEHNAFVAMSFCGNRKELGTFAEQHYLSISAYLDAKLAVAEYSNVLQSSGCLPDSVTLDQLDSNSDNLNLLKALMAASFPLVRAKLPAARYDEVIGGTVRRETVAKEVKYFDETGRVFVHPSSSLFSEKKIKSGFCCYFTKQITSKPFIRQVGASPLMAVLLFAGEISSIPKGVSVKIGGTDAMEVKIVAWSRTAALVTALKKMLDVGLKDVFDEPQLLLSKDMRDLTKQLIKLIDSC